MKIDDATLSALEWSEVCARVAERTSAEAAADALVAWRPYDTVEEARTALAEVDEAMRLLEQDEPIPAPFVEDQARTVRTLGVEGSVLEGSPLVSAAKTLRGARKWAAFLERDAETRPNLTARFRATPSEAELEERILSAFDPEARLLDRASPDLARLRGEVRRHRRDLVDFLERVLSRLSSTLVSSDSRPTIREGRYVVPVRREALSDVPGIVHDESSSGATIFLEPHDAIERNNALRRAEMSVRREEERILEGHWRSAAASSSWPPGWPSTPRRSWPGRATRWRSTGPCPCWAETRSGSVGPGTPCCSRGGGRSRSSRSIWSSIRGSGRWS